MKLSSHLLKIVGIVLLTTGVGPRLALGSEAPEPPEDHVRLKAQVIAVDPRRGANLRISEKKYPKVGSTIILESASHQAVLELKVLKFEPEQTLLRAKTTKILSNGAEKLKGASVSILAHEDSLESLKKAHSKLDHENGGGSSSFQSGPSARMTHRFGIDLGVLDGLSTFSGGLSFNLFDWLKLNASFGYGASAISIFGGIRGYVPSWNLSPTLGIHAAYLTFSSASGSATTVTDVTINGLVFSSASGGGIVPYSTLGLDWQSNGGIHLAAGTFLYFSPFTISGFYGNLGYYF